MSGVLLFPLLPEAGGGVGEAVSCLGYKIPVAHSVGIGEGGWALRTLTWQLVIP
jgi:hypothetical protein